MHCWLLFRVYIYNKWPYSDQHETRDAKLLEAISFACQVNGDAAKLINLTPPIEVDHEFV